MNCEVTGKVRYPSYRVAWKYGAHLSKQTGHSVRAYRCEFCGCYHLTTSKWRPVKVDNKPPMA